MRLLSRFTTAAMAALLLVGAPAVADAQSSTTTGGIRGRVTGDAGTPVAAAQIVAVNQETGYTRAVQSDDDGTYVIRLVPSGTYRVSARRIGNQPAELTGIRVVVGSTATANFSLVTAVVTLSSQVITAAAPPIDVTDGGVKTTVSTEQIAELPALGRDFTDFINLSGLVSPSPEATTGGQFSIAGQRPSQTNIQIDGVDANNSFFGENRGGSRIPFAFSIESVKEFQIITNGYDVEYGNYSGGLINIITKGGTNDFKGTIYGNTRGDNLTKRDFEGNLPRNFSAQQYAAQVQGPIIKDKLFYLFSYDGQRRREPFRPITRDFLANSNAPGDAFALDTFFNVLGTQYGVANAAAGFNEFQTSNDVTTLFGRMDWNINGANRLSLRNNFSTYTNGNETFGGTFTGGLSLAEVIKDRANSAVGELTTQFRSNVINTLRVQYANEQRPRVGNELRPGLVVRISPTQQVQYGGQSIAFDNNLDESKLQVVNNLNVDLGRHSLKFGTNNTFANYDNRFYFAGSGIYTFNSLADFEAQRPTRYTRNVRSDGRTPTANFSTQEYGVYAQDDWQITPKLLGSFGVRYDITRLSERPSRVIDVERAFGLVTGNAPNDNNNFSPRASLTYDVTGDGRSVIRTGAGYFYGRVPFVLAGNVASTDVPTLNLDCSGSAADNDPNAPPSVGGFAGLPRNGSGNPLNCAGAAGVGGIPEYAFWTNSFQVPETFKGNVGYERLFGDRTRLSVDALYSTTTKLYTVRNINLRDAELTLANEGGRKVFVPESQFDPINGAGTARLRNTDFGNVFVNYNDGAARSASLTSTIERTLSERSAVTANYTYTYAKDNSSFSCCTSFAGFADNRYGADGPNVIGAIGDESRGWGYSSFLRAHTVVLSGRVRLPYDVQLSTIWRIQSGTPWGPEVSGDLNGDGIRFNDRPYIFRPESLPVFVSPTATALQRDSTIAATRTRYSNYLQEFDCIGSFVGRIIERNSCRQPMFNRLDLSVRKNINTVAGQRAQLSIDLFNVLNGLNSNWGQYRGISAASRNLLAASGYDVANDQILYTVPTTLGSRRSLGSNLLLQFSAQLGLRYYF